MGSLLGSGSVKVSPRTRSFSKTTFTWPGANWTTSWAKAATAARATAIGNIPRIAYWLLDPGTRCVLQGRPKYTRLARDRPGKMGVSPLVPCSKVHPSFAGLRFNSLAVRGPIVLRSEYEYTTRYTFGGSDLPR